MKLNKEELLIGGIYGLCFTAWYGFWVIPVAVGTSLFWAIGGRYGHAWRVFSVPIIAYGGHFISSPSLSCVVSGTLTGLVLSIGYGIPDETDDGSALGRFWVRIVKYHDMANFMTRLTIYILLAISSIPVFYE